MRVGGQLHAPAALPPGMTRYPLYRRLGGPQGRSARVSGLFTCRGDLWLLAVHVVGTCSRPLCGGTWTAEFKGCQSVVLSITQIKTQSVQTQLRSVYYTFFFLGGGTDPDAIYNLCLILKIML
jgi:hypothetical protein